ncbi:MAG: BspA family leucine-rich repeat surface protein, partial [Bacteroidaceae bacterium]|nr:BspA family leucine-rich repeat surface protein [Bacteroidaceae bacterium]
TAYWFTGCKNLTIIEGIKNLKTDNVTSMVAMFENCSSLTSLDLSNFNTENVTGMGSMFSGCSSLTTLYAGAGWSMGILKSSAWMFGGCTSLVGGQGTTYNDSHTDGSYAHIDGGTSNPGYFTSKSLKGDANLDGTVSIADGVAVLNAMAGQEVPGNPDVNGDKELGIADFVSVLNIMAGQ